MKKIIKDNRGITALVTIVVIAAAVLIMAFSASILSIGSLDNSYISSRGAETHALAEGCVEEALRRLRIDSNFSSSSLSFGSGSCIISVSSSGNDRTILVTANIESKYYKKVQVDLTLSGANNNIITINDWKEVSN